MQKNNHAYDVSNLNAQNKNLIFTDYQLFLFFAFKVNLIIFREENNNRRN